MERSYLLMDMVISGLVSYNVHIRDCTLTCVPHNESSNEEMRRELRKEKKWKEQPGIFASNAQVGVVECARWERRHV